MDDAPFGWVALTCRRGDRHLVRFDGERKAVIRCAWDGEDYSYYLTEDDHWFCMRAPEHPDAPSGSTNWTWTIFSGGFDQQIRLDKAYATWKSYLATLILAPGWESH